MTAYLSPSPFLHFDDNAGNPLSGGLLFTYLANTTTKAATYIDSSQTTMNTNPIVLDSRGECNCWLPPGQLFTYVLSPSTDSDPPTNIIKTINNVGSGGSVATINFAVDTGIVNASIATLAGLTSLTTGQTLTLKVAVTNTGPATLNVNGLGVKSIVLQNGAVLSAGELQAGGQYLLQYTGSAWQILGFATAGGTVATAAEIAANVTVTNTLADPGSFYRYGAKGGAGRTGDAVFAAAVLTSASGGFAAAQAGMIAVVVDGGSSRPGGRPEPLITTILSVQSPNQITLSNPVIQPGTVTMTGTLNGSASVTSTSLNPITAGIGLTRNWKVTGVNIPSGATVTQTSATGLGLSVAATGSGVVTLTLNASIEVCYGFDDSVAILAALSLPYPITDVADNFLSSQPLAENGAGCNNVQIPSSLIMLAIPNNTQHCVTLAGLDRTNGVNYLVGVRYLPFKFEFGEIDCCNTGLAGLSLGPSNFSTVRGRITNPFRSAFEEFFLVDGHWQEGNVVDITCGRVGHHFHHKVTKSASYQTLGGYRIMGRAPGLNSVYLGINASTQKDQLGGGIRMYTGGGSVADAGMDQNTWGMGASCELDGERNCALSFGSDICNSPITYVDASASYVIEGAASAAFSNTYRNNLFGAMVIEDISQGSDARGGYQYYAMANTVVQGATILSPAAGPWGQTYINPNWQNGADNFTRYSGFLTYSGIVELAASGNTTSSSPLLQGGNGVTPAPPLVNTQDTNVITVPTGSVYATCIAGDNNLMFFAQDATGGGGCIGFMTVDSTTVTLVGNTLAGISFKRTATVGLQATSTSGVRSLRVMAFAVGA